MGQNQAGVSVSHWEVLSSEFLILTQNSARIFQHFRITQNPELRTSSPVSPVPLVAHREYCGLDTLQIIPVFSRDCIPSVLEV